MTQKNQPDIYDLFVIGGGINGVGIPRDAAGRGLSVYLCEKGDLAQGTSSASTKLIHGGLRYLEFYEFRLVREALKEREVLLQSAPHIIWPIEFVLPTSATLRPAWMIRLGLFLYDHLARRKRLPGSYSVDLKESRFGRPFKKYVKAGFVYSDCWVEDSRLVVLNALDAAARGASVNPYTKFIGAEIGADNLWHITVAPQDLSEHDKDGTVTLKARQLVNAAGPGLSTVAKNIVGAQTPPRPLRLVKGSHIVTKRLYGGEHAYILQHPDRRMVFVIPFEDKYSLIGTTDQEVDEAEAVKPKISDHEIDYLLAAVNLYFKDPISREDVKYTYSGIRPLFDDGSTETRRVTRDYHLVLDQESDNGAAALSVFGGKITTFRRLAEEAVNRLMEARNLDKDAWTAEAILPGGDIGESLTLFTQKIIETYPFLPDALLVRWSSHYGTRVHELLKDVKNQDDLGAHLGDALYAREIDFLCRTARARTPDDILLRRTKLGLGTSPVTKTMLADYLAKNCRK